MKDFINKFKIPTLLGLGIIIIGIIAGLYLVLREQTFLSKAAADLSAQNITITNISEGQVSLSWQTKSPTVSFITFGQNSPNEQTALDDRDTDTPKPYSMHYVTLENLLPQTSYQFKIISGKIASDPIIFTTAQPLTNQTGFTPVIGSVMDQDLPLNDGVAYLSISGAATQSALVKEGNFLIPISQIRKVDFSDAYPLTEETIAKITIISGKGEASLLFRLKASLIPLPPIKLGQKIDLTTPDRAPIDKYDLNEDGKINSADYALVLKNKIDLNEDGKVDQKDLDLMGEQINQ